MAVVEGGYAVEKSLHRRFASLRTVGEWFEPGDDLLGFIVAEGRPWDGRDECPTTPVRVTDDFAEAIKEASTFEKLSTAEFATAYLLPIVRKRYKDAVLKEAKRVGGDAWPGRSSGETT